MALDVAAIVQQLPQLEFFCDRLYNAQVRTAGNAALPASAASPRRATLRSVAPGEGPAAGALPIQLCIVLLPTSWPARQPVSSAAAAASGLELTRHWRAAGSRLTLIACFSLQDPEGRTQAEQALLPFAKSTDYVAHLRVRRCQHRTSARRRATRAVARL